MITALDKTRNAIIQIGSVLLVKVDDRLVVRNLTQVELAHWERNPALFRDPAAALDELQRAAKLASSGEMSRDSNPGRGVAPPTEWPPKIGLPKWIFEKG